MLKSRDNTDILEVDEKVTAKKGSTEGFNCTKESDKEITQPNFSSYDI
jgi:hypothetical protein